MVLPQPMNPARHTRGESERCLAMTLNCGEDAGNTGATSYSRFEILIVPLKEESSTLARPSFIEPKRLFAMPLRGAGMLCRSGTTGAWLITLP